MSTPPPEPPAVPQPERPIDAGWLALREPADDSARQHSAPLLLPALVAALRSRAPAPGSGALRVLDLGTGTGANVRWLAPRLPWPEQHWLLLDHDPDLLARRRAAPGVTTAEVRADVAELPALLGTASRPGPLGAVDLVTTAALLDLLPAAAIGAVVRAVLGLGVPALFSLTVIGQVSLTPPHPLDAELAAAFDAHQRRDGLLGPQAAAHAVDLFRDGGWQVLQAPSPWQLGGPEQADLVRAWLGGWSGAAVEHRPELAAPAGRWLDARTDQLAADAGREGPPLRVRVGHLDLLAVPGDAG